MGERSIKAADQGGGTAGSSAALDQWRGLALLMVLISHAFHETGRVEGLGRVGVNLFFFISGILVYRSLSRSGPRTGPASTWQQMKSFWWRRLRRLYPALLMFLLVLTIAEYWLQRIPGQPPGGDYATYWRNLPSALFALVNYNWWVPTSLGHLWSVACELQFYLAAPLLFFWGAASKGNRTLIFGYILLGLVGMGLMNPFSSDYWFATKYEFQNAVWPMMLGFVCEYQRGWFTAVPATLRRLVYWGLMAVSLPGLALMFWGPEMKVPTIAVGGLLLGPCLLDYVGGQALSPGVAGSALDWLGKRTYSIYLWQQLFTICHYLPVVLWGPGATVAVMVGAAWYRWFEVPFLSVGRRSES
jgi:peptidoglycan/LPS O-acetylase OafA/YrhL